MDKNIAIITARGGSKRIPKKNIKDFQGKPIIAYGIEAALESGIFQEVMVSTDSVEIAEVAKQYGAEVPFMRSAKNSDDYATTSDVLLEVLDQYYSRGECFKYMTCIYPTAPFITADKLKFAMEKLQTTGASMVMPVVPFSYPPLRGYTMEGERIKMKWPEYRTSRSQDLETIYHDAGQFYCYDAEEYRVNRGKVQRGIVPVVISELEVQDIDNETDWKLAELKYRMWKGDRESMGKG